MQKKDSIKQVLRKLEEEDPVKEDYEVVFVPMSDGRIMRVTIEMSEPIKNHLTLVDDD